MKKEKKLALRKETIEVLSRQSLADAKGGITPALTIPIIVGYTIGRALADGITD